MSFTGASRLTAITRGISALTLSKTSRAASPLLSLNNTTGTQTLLQVRTATKKVAGSRTNMRDSAGRRLGAKVAENQPVKTGQILFRQRGTKFYPGENTSIGKDHTIYATEPGYVRFYLDPFHPKRKFIGVALRPDLRLPTPHFEPRVRRLGYLPIIDPKKAEFEENNLPRKAHLIKSDVIQSLEDRKHKRQELISQYSEQVRKFVTDLSEEQSKIAGERLLSLRNLIKNGVSPAEAQATTTSIYIQELKLKSKNGTLAAAEVQNLSQEYITLSEQLDNAVSFDNKYNLMRFTTEDDRKARVIELAQQLDALVKSSEGKKTRKQIEQLLYGSPYITDYEKRSFIGRFLKATGLLEAKDKNTPLKKWNYEKKRVETITRTEAFA